jgi:hypothetical protein
MGAKVRWERIVSEDMPCGNTVLSTYGSPPLPEVSLCTVLVTWGQQCSETIKEKVSEVIHIFLIVCHSG